MAIDDRAGNEGQDRAATPRSRLFAVRLWTEDVAGGRDLVGGALRGFRDRSDLAAFMIARLDEDERGPAKGAEGGNSWPLAQRR